MQRGENGRRVNPYLRVKFDIQRVHMTFDGDHALGNNFGVRSAFTIQEVINITEQAETIMQDYSNWQFKDDLREFLKTRTRDEIKQLVDEICDEEGWDQ